ncbi:acyl-CoA dehydrogenase, partial [Metarhizium robertsii]
MDLSKPILNEEIWSLSREQYPSTTPEAFRLHYDRARSMCRNIDDIHDLSPKFWAFHFDYANEVVIATRDMTAFIIATIHLNLCIGTLSSFFTTRPDLSNLLDDLLSFRTCGEFMLTEVGHGLDARNLETAATLLPNGCFDLHSPNESAWKAMPPSTPLCGMPRVAIVFARLIVGHDDHGVKPFVVELNDSQQMRRGITSSLPVRPGTKPLDHGITSFDHVLLPPTALLGSEAKQDDARRDFLQQIWRVSIGTLSLSIMGVSALRIGSRVALTYSRR